MQGQERDLDQTCGSLPTQSILRFCFTFSTYTSNFLHVFSVQTPFLGGRRCHLVFLEKSIFLEKLVFFSFLGGIRNKTVSRHPEKCRSKASLCKSVPWRIPASQLFSAGVLSELHVFYMFRSLQLFVLHNYVHLLMNLCKLLVYRMFFVYECSACR